MELLGISSIGERFVLAGAAAWTLRAAWKKAALSPAEKRATFVVGGAWAVGHTALDLFAHSHDWWHWNAIGLGLGNAQMDMELTFAVFFGMAYAIIHRRAATWFEDTRGPLVMLMGAVTIATALFWFMARTYGMISFAPRPGFWPGTLGPIIAFQVATAWLFRMVAGVVKETPRVFLPGVTPSAPPTPPTP